MKRITSISLHIFFCLSIFLLLSGISIAAGQSSTNYTIETDVVSGGGGTSVSTNYMSEHTVGQPTPIETSGTGSSSANYTNYPGFWHATLGLPSPDTDGDGIPDSLDNCYLTINPGQQDTDGDGYGNACDADLDNDGVVGFNDYNVFGQAWGSDNTKPNWNPDADFDSDGAIGFNDYNIFGKWWGTSAPWH